MSFLFKKSCIDSLRDAEMVINNRPIINNAISRARFDKAQDADIREPKVGDVLKYYHPRTGKYVGKVKVVNIHRHSDAKWDAQYECEYLDGELKGGRFRDEGGANISFDSAAMD